MISQAADDSFIITPPVTVKHANLCAQRGCSSHIVKRKYSFTWDTTQKFRAALSTKDPITSPTFRLGSKMCCKDVIEALFVINPSGKFWYNSARTFKIQYISLFFRTINTVHNSSSIRGDLTFKIGNDERYLTIGTDLSSYVNGWGIHNVMYKISHPDGTHPKITCTMVLDECTELAPTSGGANVLNGLKKLCMSDRFSDVTIVVGDSHLKAHKNILSTQSPVFEAMFSSDFQEAKSNVINIVDMTVDVVKEMLRYIYSGSVVDLQGTAEGLLVAADKYCLPDLKTMCEEDLLENITVENAARVLRLSDLHRADQLKVKAAEFMRCHMDEVQVTDGWKMLKKTSAELIFECFVEKH